MRNLLYVNYASIKCYTCAHAQMRTNTNTYQWPNKINLQAKSGGLANGFQFLYSMAYGVTSSDL